MKLTIINGNNTKNSLLLISGIVDIYLEAVPNEIRLNNQIEYPVPKKIPVAPNIAIIGFCWKAPANDINSPIKLPENGVAMLARVAKKKINDKIGMLVAIPL